MTHQEYETLVRPQIYDMHKFLVKFEVGQYDVIDQIRIERSAYLHQDYVYEPHHSKLLIDFLNLYNNTVWQWENNRLQ